MPRTKDAAADTAPDADASLRRLGGGRWQTRDERFTIESQSGTWVVVDGRQTDELGLPLVRGPFRSLGEAKLAIEAARGAGPTESSLGERIARRRAAPPAPPTGAKAEAHARAKRPRHTRGRRRDRRPTPDRRSEPTKPRSSSRLRPPNPTNPPG